MAHKILVVNDEKAVSMLLKHRIEQLGFSVDTALDGETALEKARATSYNLILLDYYLPGINGGEVCQALKSDTTTEPIPIFLTSSMDAQKLHTIIKEVNANGRFNITLTGDELHDELTKTMG
jgi:two-component system, OmpR family, alkaline phosphatase synthesis response regulator PhoP